MRFLLFFFFIGNFTILAQEANDIEVYSFDNSEVSIHGRSNISGFECELFDFSNNFNVKVKSTKKGNGIFLEKAEIALNTTGFVCNNKKMTKDFLTAIKSEYYPEIKILIKEIYLNESVADRRYQEGVMAVIAVDMAGVQKSFDTQLDFILFEVDKITLRGAMDMQMSHFNIHPPSALFGMVKAEDEVKIDFRITFNLKQ